MKTKAKSRTPGFLSVVLGLACLPCACGGISKAPKADAGGISGSADGSPEGGATGTGGSTSVLSATGGASTTEATGPAGSAGKSSAGDVSSATTGVGGSTAVVTGKGGSTLVVTSAGGVVSGGTGGGQTTGPGGAGGTGIGGSVSTGTTGVQACPGTGGPAMVKLPPGFCIDSTEVTRSQYETWLAGNPPTTGQNADCASNSTFAPDARCMGNPNAPNYVCLENCGNHPQVCIDWCDAYAYCKAVGKRLCGKIGGGSNSPSDYANPSLSEWYNACTSQGANSYPYGVTQDPKACNGLDHWPQGSPPYEYQTVPVGSLLTCQSSAKDYSGVFDLSGSVEEFEDSCATSGSAKGRCNIRGGSFASSRSHLPCDSDALMHRESFANDIGFRCCSSP